MLACSNQFDAGIARRYPSMKVDAVRKASDADAKENDEPQKKKAKC